ncbi:MAG: protein kinase domain-containing protein [Planctomycetota bacterium]
MLVKPALKCAAMQDTVAAGRESSDGGRAHASPGSPALGSLPQRLGDFTLLRRLGSGGQGEVWEARQESLGRIVALKVLAPGFVGDDSQFARLRHEAVAGGGLSHKHIAVVHAVGEHEGRHYIAQELVPEGRTLADLLEEARRLPELPRDWPQRCAELAASIAEALHAAHAAGVIHRDVKPGNVLLMPDGTPKLADFGLALRSDSGAVTRSGALEGSPAYMSPEQALGGRIGLDHRSDVFSLGGVLYELLTLRRPFLGDSREQVLRRVILEDPPDPRRIAGRVPRELAIICGKALEKRRERRYDSAGHLASDLRRFLRNEPILARPAGPLLRTAKWTRRHPVASAVAAVVCVALLVLGRLYVELLGSYAETSSALNKVDEERRQAEAVAVTLGEVLSADSEMIAELTADHRARLAFLSYVERAVEQADALASHPEMQWYLRVLSGALFRDLGQPERAEPLLVAALEQARAVRHEEPGFAEHVARTALELARLRHTQRRWDEAATLFAESLALRQALHPAASREIADVRLGQARLARARGQTAQAEQELRSLLDELPAGPLDDLRFAALVLWGDSCLTSGRLAEAEAQFAEAERIQGPLVSDLHAARLVLLQARLGEAQAREQRARGDLEALAATDARTEGLYRQLIARQRELFGGAARELAGSLSDYGVFLRQRLRLPEARVLLTESLEMALRVGGLHDAVTLVARNGLGSLEWSEQNREAALAQWEAVLESDRVAPQADSAPTLAALRNLTVAQMNLGNYGRAAELAEQLVSRTAPDDPEGPARRQLLETARAYLAAAPTPKPQTSSP